MMNRAVWGTLFLACVLPVAVRGADEPIFSGPQVGEKLASFKVKGIYDDDAGKELDYIKKSAGKTMFVVFVHETTRPSLGVTRTLMEYAATRKKDGLFSAIVFLPEDMTKTENWLKRVRYAMPKKTSCRSWAALCNHARVRLKAENDRLQHEVFCCGREPVIRRCGTINRHRRNATEKVTAGFVG